jgi:4-hydroxy 2-oxovalerate aldolase
MNDSAVILLDVSLRDGGHRFNFHFKDNELEEILKLLDNSGVEYVEVGYRNGPLNPVDNMGKAGHCDKEYLLFCRSLLKKAKMAVMICPNNPITQKDLMELKDCGVDLLRMCVPKNGIGQILSKIKMAKQAHIELAMNFIQISSYNKKELDEAIRQISELQPNIIYFADSNGSLSPTRITELYQDYINNYPIPFGFHAHDNLGLAQANALAALNSGVRYIDVSLAGMGKGTGNLKTEFFIAYLHSIQLKKYDLESVLNAANYVRHSLKIVKEPV